MSIKVRNETNLENSPYSSVVNGDNYTTHNYYNNFEDLNFTKESIEFLSNFSNLHDYLFPKIFNLKETFKAESDYDLLGIKIFDWIIGFDKFPSEEYFKLFCNDNLEIYNKRRICLNDYFSSNIEKCIESYDHIYSIIDSLDCSDNYKNDILIDGRNINIEYNHLNSKMLIKDKFQAKITKEKKNINTPLYDRIKATIYEKATLDIFNEEMQTKHEFYSSTSLQDALNKVQDLILLALYNGSITHLKLSRKVIFNLLYNYTKVYDDILIYEYLLYLSAISLDYKNHAKIKNYIKRKYNYQLSKEVINRLYSFKDIVNKGYIISFLAFFYSNYKFCIDDEKCINIEKMLLNYICKGNHNINFIYEILKAFNDTTRVFNLDLLLKCIDYIINKNYIRYFREISDILNNIEINKLNDKQYKKYVKLVKKAIKLEHADVFESIAKILTKNKNTRGLKKYTSNKNVLCYLPDSNLNNDFNLLEDAIKYYNELYEEKEKNPETDRKPDYFYNFERDFFKKNADNLKFKNYVFNETLAITSKILKSENQSNYLKSEVLKLLISIFSNTEYDNLIKHVNLILESTKLSTVKAVEYINFFGKHMINKEDIELELATIKILLGESKNLDLFFEKYESQDIDSCIFINCIISIAEKYKGDNQVLGDVYKLYKILLKHSEYYERYNTIYIIKSFKDTIYNDKALEELERLSCNCDFDEASCIKKVASNFDKNYIVKIQNNFLNNIDVRVRNIKI